MFNDLRLNHLFKIVIKMNVAMLFFDEVDVLNCVGPYEVLYLSW
jgi:hypothetical protein